MQHPPYGMLDSANDGVWLACFVAAAIVALGSNLPARGALPVFLGIPAILRWSGSGGGMGFLTEFPLLGCAVLIVVCGIIWPGKPRAQIASAARAFPLGWIAAAIAVSIFTAVALYFPRPRPDRRAMARVTELRSGAWLYEDDHKHYPGSKSLDQLISHGGKYTGSQILAARLFHYPIEQIDGPVKPQSHYAPYRETSLFTLPDRKHPNTLADGYGKPMAICYYVARPGKKGIDRFVEGDNRVYTDAAKGGDFAEFLRAPLGDPLRPLDEMDCLLIAPGKDRKYFTEDDLTNW